jgi:hypothetical protein
VIQTVGLLNDVLHRLMFLVIRMRIVVLVGV